LVSPLGLPHFLKKPPPEAGVPLRTHQALKFLKAVPVNINRDRRQRLVVGGAVDVYFRTLFSFVWMERGNSSLQAK
jgi:hypothetical protein